MQNRHLGNHHFPQAFSASKPRAVVPNQPGLPDFFMSGGGGGCARAPGVNIFEIPHNIKKQE